MPKRDGAMAPDEALGPGRRAGTWARWSPLPPVEGGESHSVELGFGQKVYLLQFFWGGKGKTFLDFRAPVKGS